MREQLTEENTEDIISLLSHHLIVSKGYQMTSLRCEGNSILTFGLNLTKENMAEPLSKPKYLIVYDTILFYYENLVFTDGGSVEA